MFRSGTGSHATREERQVQQGDAKLADFPLGYPPEFVLECAQTDYRLDLETKAAMYAAANVKTYMIIHNDAPNCDDKEKHNPAVFMGRLVGHRYQGLDVPLRGTDKVDIPYIGQLEAQDLIKAHF
ncbi:hypothetical protein FGB62_73g11 [Gracilaria domingensis]|nr:hypothetical protein FGB62_73g11 [Gracilaria domingensis]